MHETSKVLFEITYRCIVNFGRPDRQQCGSLVKRITPLTCLYLPHHRFSVEFQTSKVLCLLTCGCFASHGRPRGVFDKWNFVCELTLLHSSALLCKPVFSLSLVWMCCVKRSISNRDSSISFQKKPKLPFFLLTGPWRTGKRKEKGASFLSSFTTHVTNTRRGDSLGKQNRFLSYKQWQGIAFLDSLNFKKEPVFFLNKLSNVSLTHVYSVLGQNFFLYRMSNASLWNESFFLSSCLQVRFELSLSVKYAKKKKKDFYDFMTNWPY